MSDTTIDMTEVMKWASIAIIILLIALVVIIIVAIKNVKKRKQLLQTEKDKHPPTDTSQPTNAEPYPLLDILNLTMEKGAATATLNETTNEWDITAPVVSQNIENDITNIEPPGKHRQSTEFLDTDIFTGLSQYDLKVLRDAAEGLLFEMQSQGVPATDKLYQEATKAIDRTDNVLATQKFNHTISRDLQQITVKELNQLCNKTTQNVYLIGIDDHPGLITGDIYESNVFPGYMGIETAFGTIYLDENKIISVAVGTPGIADSISEAALKELISAFQNETVKDKRLRKAIDEVENLIGPISPTNN